MRSFNTLYLKLLGWFTGASLLAIVATLLVVQPLWRFMDDTAERLPVWGQQAIQLHEQGDERALRQHLRTLLHEHRTAAILLDASGQPVSRPRMPPHLRAKLLAPENADRSALFRRHHLTRMKLNGQQGSYEWRALLPPPGREAWQSIGPIRLLVFLSVMAAMAFIFVRWLGRPLQSLRRATERMASGQLDSRAEPRLAKRSDEIGQLARAFDDMAARLQTMLANKERLLRDVSHELRSPIARLEVALELARERSGASAVNELARIDLETQRLKALIDQVMTLSRLEDPESGYRFERLDLSALLQALCEDSRHLPDIQLSGHITSGLDIEGNASLLHSAVDNLIRNAHKYSPPETLIELGLLTDGDCLKIQVSDRGPGIPEDQLVDIFRPFYQVSTSRTPDGADVESGYGVGLAIVQRVAALHGGTVNAVNREGGGLTVSLVLPRVRR